MLFRSYRKRLNHPQLVESDRLERVSDHAAHGPEEEVAQAERFLALHEALERLEKSDPNAAEVCRLRCFGKELPFLFGQHSAHKGMKLQELADWLGLPLSTVHSRWKRAVLFLSNQLQGFAPEDVAKEEPL